MKRTDMISELTEDKKGFKTHKKRFGNVRVTIVRLDKKAGLLIKKPAGQYCTVSFEEAAFDTDIYNLENAVIYCLGVLLKEPPENVLIAGLGNCDITPDALGVITADKIINTRHLSGNHRKVCTVIPSVAGKTGIESSELICAAVKEVNPDAIIVIDALASANKASVCKTIQLTDIGIAVGSGAYKSKAEFSKQTLGVPVIAIGMPTVITAEEDGESLMLTPKNIDVLLKGGAEVISDAINRYLHS